MLQKLGNILICWMSRHHDWEARMRFDQGAMVGYQKCRRCGKELDDDRFC